MPVAPGPPLCPAIWRVIFCALVIASSVHALATHWQLPLSSSSRRQGDEYYQAITTIDHGDGDLTGWSLDSLPNPNATDHLVFETVHSLLQQWPNVRMRNGHNIVPGIVPQGTLLYHGRLDKEFPTTPDWVALDPEYSHLFVRNLANHSQHDGWHLTLMTTRPLKVVYFDGSGVVKLAFGSMDTQDLIVWGKPDLGKNKMEADWKRIKDMCNWGANFGVDGFVRMGMNFEIMLCDFTSGSRVVSFDHLTSEISDKFVYPPSEFFEVINAGTWHNHFPGETRIQLDLSSLISFYDTRLAPSLIPIRAGQERWDHRVLNVSDEDLLAAKSLLEKNLINSNRASSGIDWKTLIQVIVDRYAQRLELTRYLVSSPSTNPDKILDFARKTQTQLRIMLTPYVLYSVVPSGTLDEATLDWSIPIYKQCATIHTTSMEFQFESMTNSELLLLRAVRGTSQEICRVVTKMWAAGVYAGIDPSLNTKASPNITEVTRLRDTWAGELDRLMAWLDWSVWVKCNPECGIEEKCYLPTFPIGFPSYEGVPSTGNPFPIEDDDENLADALQNAIKPELDEWIRPQPKCIKRTRPHTY